MWLPNSLELGIFGKMAHKVKGKELRNEWKSMHNTSSKFPNLIIQCLSYPQCFPTKIPLTNIIKCKSLNFYFFFLFSQNHVTRTILCKLQVDIKEINHHVFSLSVNSTQQKYGCKQPLTESSATFIPINTNFEKPFQLKGRHIREAKKQNCKKEVNGKAKKKKYMINIQRKQGS